MMLIMKFGLYRGQDISTVPDEYLSKVSRYLQHEAERMREELERRCTEGPAADSGCLGAARQSL
jgi:hypothetical protein